VAPAGLACGIRTRIRRRRDVVWLLYQRPVRGHAVWVIAWLTERYCGTRRFSLRYPHPHQAPPRRGVATLPTPCARPHRMGNRLTHRALLWHPQV